MMRIAVTCLILYIQHPDACIPVFFSAVGQLQSLPAFKEPASEFAFHPGDGIAQRLLADLQLFRGAGNAVLFRRGQEIFHVLEIHKKPP